MRLKYPLDMEVKNNSKAGVKIENPEKLCSAGLIAAGIISQNLARPDMAKRLKGLDLTMHVLASRMKFTIIFREGRVEIKEGHEGRAGVTLRAPFSALVKLALRKIPSGNILMFKVYVFGNYLKFLRAAPLLQVHDPVPPELLEGG